MKALSLQVAALLSPACHSRGDGWPMDPDEPRPPMMRADRFTNTEADAGRYERVRSDPPPDDPPTLAELDADELDADDHADGPDTWPPDA